MTRVLRSASKKNQAKENLSSKLSVNQKSKTIKRRGKKAALTNNDDIQANDMWSINSILSNIFKYTDYKDLVEFSTVSKKWNSLTNPIIRKSIKLQRSNDIKNKVHDKRFNKAAKTNAEVEECIANNAKFAHFFKEFKFSEKLEPQLAINFFETFKYITSLTIERITMSQDQFLGMISPLTQLKELNLRWLKIKKIYRKRLYTKVVQLPPTLTKLAIDSVSLIDSPDLFVQTINTHSNLVEFVCNSHVSNGLLKPFQKNYPSLTSFEYTNRQLNNPQDLFDIFKFNPQLITLKLNLTCWNNELTDHISTRLVNLEEFDFDRPKSYFQDDSTIHLKLSRPTKIKKLKLGWDKLSQSSLESILMNCPELEDLSLNCYEYLIDADPQISITLFKPTKIKKLSLNTTKLSEFSLDSIISKCPDLEELNLYCYCSYMSYNSEISLNFNKPTKIKKLIITDEKLSILSLDSILLNCPQLKDLEIRLPRNWNEHMKTIGSRCISLEKLTIHPFWCIHGQTKEDFYKELHEQEFLSTNSNYKSTLTNLTLFGFNINSSKAEYFNSFNKLKSINYLGQTNTFSTRAYQGINFDMELWPNYRSNIKETKYSTDIELVKLFTQ